MTVQEKIKTYCNKCEKFLLKVPIDLRKEGNYWVRYEANTNYSVRHYCVQECRNCKEAGAVEGAQIKLLPFRKPDSSMGWKPQNPDGTEHKHFDGQLQNASELSASTSTPKSEIDKAYEDLGKKYASRNGNGAAAKQQQELPKITINPTPEELSLQAILTGIGNIHKQLEEVHQKLDRLATNK